jgi:hypothetical protein
VLVSPTLGSRENGLAIVITTRTNGSPHASLVTPGVLDHPTTREPVVGFVSRGAAVSVDCRPSDGVAVAERRNVPIIAADDLEPVFAAA